MSDPKAMPDSEPDAEWDALMERAKLHYFDKAGEPITFEEWIELMRDPNYRVVGFFSTSTDTDAAVAVSTTWSGFDMGLGWLVGGPPTLFDCSVFAYGRVIANQRFTSLPAAAIAHDFAVRTYVEADRVARANQASGGRGPREPVAEPTPPADPPST